jgi:3-oxoacyl-[acyl-carrier protein] reductase
MLLKDKIALVTGASRGIGAETAKLFALEGARVVVNYNSNEAAARQVVEEIISKNGQAFAVQADVTDVGQVEKMMEIIRTQYGEVDILVINAGLHFKVAPFMQQTWEEFSWKYYGEMKSFYNSAKAVIPGMIAKKCGVIVAVSSGLSRHPGMGFSSHSASKSAVDALVKSLALELGPSGIRVNTVAPGLTITDATSWMPKEQQDQAANRTALKKNGEPDDIAKAILFMASDLSSHVTGTYLSVDGGSAMI